MVSTWTTDRKMLDKIVQALSCWPLWPKDQKTIPAWPCHFGQHGSPKWHVLPQPWLAPKLTWVNWGKLTISSSCSSYYGSVSTSAPEPRPESCIGSSDSQVLQNICLQFFYAPWHKFFAPWHKFFVHRDIRQLSGPSQCCNLGPGSLPSSDHLLPILLTTNQLPQYCRNTLAIPLQYYCNTAHHTTHLTILPTNSQKPQYSYNALQYSPPYPSNIIAHNTFV